MTPTPDVLSCPYCRILWAVQGRTVKTVCAVLRAIGREKCGACQQPWDAHGVEHPHPVVAQRREKPCPGITGVLDAARGRAPEEVLHG